MPRIVFHCFIFPSLRSVTISTTTFLQDPFHYEKDCRGKQKCALHWNSFRLGFVLMSPNGNQVHFIHGCCSPAPRESFNSMHKH